MLRYFQLVQAKQNMSQKNQQYFGELKSSKETKKYYLLVWQTSPKKKMKKYGKNLQYLCSFRFQCSQAVD
jgi:hypothetical protein